MFTTATKVVDVAPDMTLDQFGAVLVKGSALSAEDINQGYQQIISRRVSPAFCLAIFWVESKFGRLGICHDYNTKSPGNTRNSRLSNGVEFTTDKGAYVKYPTWAAGWADLAFRLVDPSYTYYRNKLETIRQILPVYAPPGDGNDPATYSAAVVELMNGWITPMQTPNITWKGSPNFWVGRWSEPVQGIVDHIMQGTMESTDGWFKNVSSQVSATFGVAKNGRIWQWVSMSDTAWANGPIKKPQEDIDWLMECVHMGYNPNKRTISIEHEGFTGDAMPEAQYQATLALHKYILSIYTTIQIDRKHLVGHYQINLVDKPNCPGTGFPWARLTKDLTAWQAAGGRGQPVEVPVNSISLNGHVLGGGFLTYYNKYGGTKVFGLPITEEEPDPDTKLTTQWFERGAFEYDPSEKNPDWQVRGKAIGSILYAQKGGK